MGEEIIDKIEKETIEIPEIGSARQAFVFMASGFAFFLSNYKKTTLIILAIIVFMGIQLATNFEQVQGIAKMFGLG